MYLWFNFFIEKEKVCYFSLRTWDFYMITTFSNDQSERYPCVQPGLREDLKSFLNCIHPKSDPSILKFVSLLSLCLPVHDCSSIFRSLKNSFKLTDFTKWKIWCRQIFGDQYPIFRRSTTISASRHRFKKFSNGAALESIHSLYSVFEKNSEWDKCRQVNGNWNLMPFQFRYSRTHN